MWGIELRRKLTFLVFLSVVVPMVKAQSSIALYPFDDHFNSSNFNPALLTSKEGITFGIFPIAGFSVGYNNQETIKQLVFKFATGVSSDEDYKEVLKSLIERSSYNQNIECTLFSLTYRANFGFLNFRVKEIQNFSANVKGELSDFIIRTDIQSAAINQVQLLPAQAMHYREYSIGYSMRPGYNRLSVGLRAKIYFGKSSFFSGISGSIRKEQTEYFLTTSGKVDISIPEVNVVSKDGTINSVSIFKGSKTTRYLMNMGNPGIGLDLGLKYRITPNITFLLSVLDLGKIFWNTNLNSKYFNSNYAIDKSDIETGINQQGVEFIKKKFSGTSFSDSLSNIFDLTYDKSSFSKIMPVTIYAGINYSLSPSLKISFANRCILVNEMSHHSYTLAAKYDINKHLSVSTGYSIIGNSKFNIPYAVLLKRNFGQVYFGTDNLLSFIMPSVSAFSGFSFGTSFYLFRTKNIYLAPTEDFPFYDRRKIKKLKNSGLILKK